MIDDAWNFEREARVFINAFSGVDCLSLASI